MQVITLMDNSPGPNGVVSEHGLSLGISIPGHEILFDTGPSPSFVGNAHLLGCDLTKIDIVVLSHGHYDHGGGLEAFFGMNLDAPLYLKEGAAGNFYAELAGLSHYIGLDKVLLERNAGRLRWVTGPLNINSNVHLIAAFPTKYPWPKGNSMLKIKSGDHFSEDRFDHELALIIKEDDGIAIFTGCGHSGVLNIVTAAKSAFPNERIKAVVGGFHQISGPGEISASTDEVREMGREMVRLGCARVYGGHCTGAEASKLLQDELGDVYQELHTGLIFEL
jgi:7,8-dihydropterin-6-yl-methyl-4-(beta-D-ribofuranosyl)aminobenzene 5'-phosphate synthase